MNLNLYNKLTLYNYIKLQIKLLSKKIKKINKLKSLKLNF